MDVSDKAGTLRAQEHGHQPIACYALKGNFIDRETQQNGIGWREGVGYTLDATDRHGVCYGISRSMLKGGMNAGGMPVEENIQPTITANGCGAVCYDAPGDREESR